MSLRSPLQQLYVSAQGELASLMMEDDPLLPDAPTLNDLIKEAATNVTPEVEKDPIALLGYACEAQWFATEKLPHWTFSEWEQAGNGCTAIALIYESVYQSVITDLEMWVESQEEGREG